MVVVRAPKGAGPPPARSPPPVPPAPLPAQGGIITTRTATALGAAAILAAVALPVLGTTDAVAAPATIYVDRASTAHCSDSGTGLRDQPFCTVSAAAAAVLPGQTVKIEPGTYPEQVTITKSGTAAAPITFEGDLTDWQYDSDAPVIGKGGDGGMSRALTISGAQHVRFRSVNFEAVDQGVLVQNSTDVSIIRSQVFSSGDVGLRVTGASQDVTLGEITNAYADGGGIVVDGGAEHTVLTTNLITVYRGTGISLTDAPDSVVVSNSVYDDCNGGINLQGASSGATIENNVLAASQSFSTQGDCPWFSTLQPEISVDATSAVGTKTDYNVLSTKNGEAAYNWSGTPYSDRAAFTAASGQGAHDAFADPDIPDDGDRHVRPLAKVDSADEKAPGMIGLEAMDAGTGLWTTAATDDPITPNTGTGSGIRDRGAEEATNVGSVYTAFGPSRVLDTRSGLGADEKGPLYGYMNVPVAGRNGLPATGISAVTLNVTVTGSTSAGFLSVFEGGTGSNSSNLNWTKGETIANQVTVPVSPDGEVGFEYHGSSGGVQVIADVEGYYSAKGGVFHTTPPARALDTRNGTGAPAGAVKGGGTVDVQITGAHGVPASGVTAVTLNVTVTAPTTAGVLTVYPHGTARPTASSLNWTAGKTIANLVTVPVRDGKVSLGTNAGSGTAQLVADVMGYYNGTGHDTYYPLNPDRMMDTRVPTVDFCTDATRPAGAIPAGGTLDIPICVASVTTVTLNVTVTAPGAGGVLTVYPSGTTRPTTSNLNWTAGETIPNAVVVSPGANRRISFYNHSSKPIHLVVDLFGQQSL